MTSRYSDPAYEGAVAIVGMALRLPGAETPDAFWRIVRDGTCVLRRFTPEEQRAAGVPEAVMNHPDYVPAGGVLADVENFDAAFFGFTPREAACLPPQNRLLYECAWEALETAGYDPLRTPGRAGLFVGQSVDTYWPTFVAPHTSDLDAGLDFYSNPDFLATGVAYKLNLRGPAMTVQSFCSTSLLAVHLARQALLEGECDLALAGGTSVRVPQHQGYTYVPESVFSPDATVRTFDAGANGTLFGNGVGVVALKRLEDALADGDRIDAIIRGSAANNDGNAKAGYNAPSVDGQARAIARALQDAAVPADTIGYVECHGTGTLMGDPIEIAALTKAFRAFTDRRQFCAVGSVKPNIGHVDRASGVVGLIKTALALRHGEMPKVINFRTPNPRIDFAGSPFYVNETTRPFPETGAPRRAGVSSLGYGGTNVHVVLEQAPPLPTATTTAVATAEPQPAQALVLSGRTPAALAAAAEALADHLEANPALPLADVAFTLQTGRHGFNHRRLVVAGSAAKAVAALRRPDAGVETTVRAPAVHLLPAAEPLDAATVAALCRQAPALRDHLRDHGGNAGAALAALLREWGAAPPASEVAEPGDLTVRLGAAREGEDALALLNGPVDDALARLAGRLWLAGVDVDWAAVHDHAPPRRVALPTTRFERRRHWLDPHPQPLPVPAAGPTAVAAMPGPVADGLVAPAPLTGIPGWRRLPPAASAAPVACRIVVLDDHGVGAALATRLEAAGETVVQVRAGERVANVADGLYTADLDDQDQIEALLTRLKLWGPAAVVCCTPLTGGRGVMASGSLSDRLEGGLGRSFFAPLRLIRAVDAVWPDRPFRLDFVSHGLFQVGGSDPLLPEQAALAPLLQTAAQEYPALALRCLDADPAAGAEALAAALAEDLRAELPLLTARRGRHLWMPVMEPADLGEERLAALLRQGGTYLVTGGLGGVGFTLARHLAETAAARLVVIGRSLPETGEKAARLGDLRRIAPEVLALAVDVSDGEAMRHALREARSRFGRIDGVIHAAGHPGESLIAGMSEAEARAVMAPKAQGTAVLLDLLAADPPDFVVLCSSMAAVVPARGQADYAAANAVQDAVTQVPQPALPVVAVNWNSWRGIGGAHEAWKRPARTAEISGHAVFRQVQHMRDGSLHYVGRLDATHHWVVSDHRINGRPTLPGTGVIDLLLAAHAHHAGAAGGLPVELAPVVFVAPLMLPEDDACDLVVTLEPTDAGFHARLESRRADDAMILHARAALRPLPEEARRPAMTVPPATPSAVPGPPQSGPLRLSGRWDCLREVAIGPHGGRAVATLSPEYQGDAAKVVLHPALLDMATSIHAYHPDAAGAMPIGYESLRVFAPAGSHLTSVGAAAETGSDGISRLSLDLLDGAGHKVAEVKGLILARPAVAADTVLRLLDTIPGEPRLTPNPFEADSITPEEAIAIFRRLPVGQAPQVLVSRHLFATGGGTVATPAPAIAPGAEPVTRQRPEVRAFLAQVWQRILGAPVPGETVSFFDLGGNSLGATRVLSQIREVFGVTLGMKAFFADPTLDALARAVEAQLAVPAAPAPAAGAAEEKEEDEEDAWETGTL